MALPQTRSTARPAHDEWGVYDPEQAGLAALYNKLNGKEKDSQPASAVKDAAPVRPTLRDAQ